MSASNKYKFIFFLLLISSYLFSLTKEEKWMIDDLKSNNEEKILHATEFFANREKIPEEAIQYLILSFKQYDYNIRTFSHKALLKNPEQSIPYLIQGLKNDSEMVREWSAKTIEAMGENGKPAIPALMNLAFDPEWNVKNAALSALKKMGDEPFKIAAKLLPKEEDEERKIFYLQIIASNPQKEIEVVLPCLDSDSYDILETTLKTISLAYDQKSLPNSLLDKVINKSLPHLKNDRKSIRMQAAYLFSILQNNPELQKKYIPQLIHELKNNEEKTQDEFSFSTEYDAYKKEGIIYAIGYIGPAAFSTTDLLLKEYQNETLAESTIFTLSRILIEHPEKLHPWITSSDPQKAEFAAKIISSMNPTQKEYIEPLIQCVDFHGQKIQNEANGKTFERCLKSLGIVGKKSYSSLQTIGKYLNSREEIHIEAALIALSQIGESGYIFTDKISGYLFHSNRDIRKWAAICLGNIGPKASSSIYELNKAVNDPDPLVKAEAARALLKIRLR